MLESSQTTVMENLREGLDKKLKSFLNIWLGPKDSESVPGELESAIRTMVDYYDKYSSRKILCFKKEGIRKSKFREMLEKELSHMLTDTKNKEAVRKLFEDLDQNGDRVIDFDEYWVLIGEIVMPVSRTMEYQVEMTAAESMGNNPL